MKSDIPPTYLEFNSFSGKHYSINHAPEHPKGPFLNLCGHDKDKTDFIHIARAVLKITGGVPEGWGSRGLDWAIESAILNSLLLVEGSLSDRFLGKALSIMNRDRDIVASIDIPQGYTQLGLYNFVQGYRRCFKDIKLDKKLGELVMNYDLHYSRNPQNIELIPSTPIII